MKLTSKLAKPLVKLPRVAALAALLAPGFVWAGQQPTATEIFNLRERCAAERRAIQDGYNEEIKKQKPIPDTESDGIYASNYNIVANKCYILHQYTTRSFDRGLDGKLLLEPPSEKTSWYLHDYQTSDTPIAYCLTGPDADKYSFTPAGNVTAKEACAFIDKMMHDDLGQTAMSGAMPSNGASFRKQRRSRANTTANLMQAGTQ